MTGIPQPHGVLTTAFDCLDGAGIPWVLLRGAEDLGRPPGDVDLLVDSAALPRLDAALAPAGLHRMGSRGHGSHRFYFSYQDDDGLWITLDVVTRIEFGAFQELGCPLAADVLARRRRVGPVWRPDPDDEAWLLLLHLLLDKGGIPADRRESARAAAARTRVHAPIGVFLDREFPGGTAREVLAAGSGSADAEECARSLARSWAGRNRAAAWWNRSRNRLLRRLEAPIQRGSRGLVVAVVGPDGAGKTTVIDAVRANYPLPSRSVHMGVWREGRWNRPLARIPAGAVLQRTTRILGGLLTVRFQSARGRLVLQDRFAHDVLLPGVVDTSRLGRVNRLLSLHLAPDPDLVLLLDAPGELMFARKGEHTPEVLEQRRQGYLAMVEALPHALVLDARRPLADVARAATAAVWRAVGGEPPVPRGPRRGVMGPQQR